MTLLITGDKQKNFISILLKWIEIPELKKFKKRIFQWFQFRYIFQKWANERGRCQKTIFFSQYCLRYLQHTRQIGKVSHNCIHLLTSTICIKNIVIKHPLLWFGSRCHRNLRPPRYLENSAMDDVKNMEVQLRSGAIRSQGILNI